MSTVTIIDSGICNLASITRALERAGGKVTTATVPEDVLSAERLVLPGVGSFPAGMDALETRGLDVAVREFAATGKQVLGICLGMQLLFETGEEYGEREGLGLIPGRVRAMQARVVPHMGWNRIEGGGDPLLDGLPQEAYFYFVHSFECEPADADDVIGTTKYEQQFCSVVKRANVRGIQAHPEKSQRCGSQLIENFLGL